MNGIKRLRLERSMSQEELAMKLNVSQAGHHQVGKRGTPIPVRTSCPFWLRRWGAALMRCFRTIWSRCGGD